ncbi:MAG: YlcI/YnfO family protein [Acidimicrobiales bacterium]
MTTTKMTDQEAAEFYAEPANQRLGTRVISRRALSSSIPVRFPPDVVDAVKALAGADGLTVSEWIRRAVADALAARHTGDDPAAILEDLRRDIDRLASKIR